VYVSIDLSGATKTYSIPIVDGLKIAAADINKDGGIDGRQVEIQTADDQNDPTRAVSLLQKKLSSGSKPDLVYAGGSSSVTLSLLPVLTRNKILSMSGTVSSVLNDPTKYPYHFSDSAPSTAYAPFNAGEMQKAGYKKVAMIYSNDATGQSAYDLYKAAMAKVGIDVISASYETTALDMTSQLQKLKAQNPDALIVNGYGTAALYVFRGRSQIGWNLPTFADQLSSSYPLVSQLGAGALENVKIVTAATAVKGGDQSPLYPELLKEIQSSDDAGSLTQTGYGLYVTGYDLLQIVKTAAAQASSTDGPAVAKAMEGLQAPSPVPWLASGKSGQATLYDYSSSNHFPSAGPNALVYVSPGTYNADGLYVPGAGGK
jgi:branched-chain amino acid transport system substrate-binding protein